MAVLFNLEEASPGTGIQMNRQMLARYISPGENRFLHICGVVKQMERLLERIHVPDRLKPLLIDAAWLHDIGYSPQLELYRFHPLDGALFAWSTGFPKPVTAAVLFHSGAHESVNLSRRDLTETYAFNKRLLDDTDRLFIDLVTWCDLHTSPVGKPVTFEERIRDILERYGEEHEVSKFIRATLGNFDETIRRVEGMFVTGA